MMIKNVQKGFSLIEVIITSSIMIVLLAAFAQLLQSQRESISFLEDQLAKTDFKQTVGSLLSDPNACRNTFLNFEVLPTQMVTDLKNQDDNVQFSSTDLTKKTFERLDLDKMELINDNLADAPDTSGTMRLVVFSLRQRDGGGPKELSPFETLITMETDSSNRIHRCQAFGTGTESGRCSNLPAGVTDPVASSYREGFLVKDAANTQYICINSDWTPVEGLVPPFCTAGDTQSCSIPNGSGQQTCNSAGDAFGSCEISSCNPGYQQVGSTCRLIPTGGGFGGGKSSGGGSAGEGGR